MYHIQLSQMLPELRNAILPARIDDVHLSSGKYKATALTVSIYISMSNRDNKQHSFMLHVMFFGNTSVFYTTTPSRLDKPDWTKAINATNHDSCWRSMEFVSPHFFNIAQHHFTDTIPNDIHQYTTITDIKLGSVIWKKDERDDNNYRRKVVEFTPHQYRLDEMVTRQLIA